MRNSKTFFGKLIAIAFFPLAVFSCQEKIVYQTEHENLSSATIQIIKTEVSENNSVYVSFIPSENSSKFEYALGLQDEENLFLEGVLDVKTIEGNDTTEVIFENLKENSSYTIYARSFDAEDNPGGLARTDVSIVPERYGISLAFLTNNSVSVKLFASAEFSHFRYYLGKKEDKEAFEKGETSDKVLSDYFGYYYVSYFDIEKGDYVFYAQAEDICGRSTEIMEIEFSTPDASEIPCAELEEVSQDAYRSRFRFTPNENCGKISAVFNFQGYYDSYLYSEINWMGDLMTAISNWDSMENMNGFNAVGEPLDIKFDDVMFTNGRLLDIYVLYWDKDMNPAGVQKYVVKKPDVDPEAPEAKVNIEVKDITKNGATYSYSIVDNTAIGFMYDTIEADWYDDFKKTSEWSATYLAERLYMAGQYWAYKDDMKDGVREYTEMYGTPSTRYYAAACPMNVNGRKGWGPEVLIEYTTLAK